MHKIVIHSKGPVKKVSDLIPYARNARTHSDVQINQLVSSFREWGFTNPVLIDEQDNIIAGHGRVLAASKAGMDQVPVVVVEGLTEAKRKALVLADNKLALNAGWDIDMLSAELEELGEADFDLSLIGFDDKELNALLTDASGSESEDEVPDAPETPVTQLGDIWQLGAHRLMCGDSTSADDVGRLLYGVRPHLMVTDPPYGVEYDPNWRNEADRANGNPYGDRAIGKVANDDRADWSEAYALFPGDVCYVWHPAAGALQNEFYRNLCDAGFDVRMQIIWSKSRFPIGRGHYHVQHEPCWYAVRKGKTGHWTGDRKQSTIWQIDHRKSETGHGTQKPVECMRRPIVNNSSPGQAVYEPFSGSGTTIIAAETTGRVCYAMEIEPKYVDVAVKRWEDMTGQTAVLEARKDDAA